MIRDHIVVGVRDSKLSESLQMDSSLTLSKAVEKVKLWEAVKSHQGTVRGISNEPRLETLAINSNNNSKNNSVKNKCSKTSLKHNSIFKCYRCGDKQEHYRDDCPAYKVRCGFCNIVGHFEKCCKKKKKDVKEVTNNTHEPSTYSDVSLGTIELSVGMVTFTPPYIVSLETKNVCIPFKIDTGADISCIPEVLWKSSFFQIKLDYFKGMIKSAGQNPLCCVGTFTCDLKSPFGKRCTEVLYVIRNLSQPLLGRTAISALRLITFNNFKEKEPLEMNLNNIDFTKLFSVNPGILKGEPYSIKIQSGAQPFAVAAPRRIPFPLVDKVKSELQKMEELNVIESVTEATEWCSPIVVAPKKDGTIRLCVDFTKLNQHVVRERLILPSTDECLAKIQNGKVFSKLDARMGFWQIPLALESRNLTTFLTPFGRYRFTRLPFGICSAPEHFKRRLFQLVKFVELEGN